MNAMTEDDLATVDVTVTNQNETIEMSVFVCNYQLKANDKWHKGIRIQSYNTKTDKIIDINGNIVKSVYRIIDCYDEGCFKTFIK